MWIGGGGSGGSGEYDCAYQTALYTRNRKRLPEAPLLRRRRFLEWFPKKLFVQAGTRLMMCG